MLHFPCIPLRSQLPYKKAPAGLRNDDKPLEREKPHEGQLKCPSWQPGPRPQMCEVGHGRYSAPAEPLHLNSSPQNRGQLKGCGFKALSSGVAHDAAIDNWNRRHTPSIVQTSRDPQTTLGPCGKYCDRDAGSRPLLWSLWGTMIHPARARESKQRRLGRLEGIIKAPWVGTAPKIEEQPWSPQKAFHIPERGAHRPGHRREDVCSYAT